MLSGLRVRRWLLATRRDGRSIGKPAARDPDNIVITPKGSPKILNFGLTAWTPSGQARAAAASPDGLGTDPEGVAGYLSPEQALGGAIDRALRAVLSRAFRRAL